MIQFYQSPSDKARFDVLLKVLSEEAPNLAIIGEDELALAHYGRAIHQRLSQLPHAQVDLWGAVDSEQLVQRFNDILSELTLEQAQDKSQKTPTRRCFIIADAHAVPTLELQLLARLIQGFPASHVHAVLLVNRHEAHQKKLEVFGKTLLRWELESEHPRPARMERIETRDAESPAGEAGAGMVSTASVLQARQATRAAAAGATVPASAAAAAPLGDRSDASAKDPWTAKVSAVMPEMDAPAAPEPVSTDQPLATPAPSRSSRWGWALLLLLLVTLAVLAVLNRDRVAEEFSALQSYVSGQRAPKTASEADSAPAGAAASTSGGMSSTSQLPVKPDDSLIPDKESIVTPSPGTSAPAAPVASPATTTPVPATAPAAAAAAAAAAAPAAPVKNAATDREAQLAQSRQWVRDLPANGWVLQHAALDSMEEARAAKAETPGLGDAHILLTQRKTKGYYYILVTGPYPNRAAAQDLMKKNPAWAKAWLRGPKSMQQQFED